MNSLDHSPSGKKNETTTAPTDKSAMVQIALESGKVIPVPAGTSVGELLHHAPMKRDRIVAVLYNNKIGSLNRPLDSDGILSFVDTTTRDGGLIYRRSLTFLLVKAFRDLFPDLKVYINHSLHKGYYGEVYTKTYQPAGRLELSESDLNRVKERMNELIQMDLPFERLEMSIPDAIELFRKEGLEDKVSLLKFRNDEKISVYQLDGSHNHFYGQLVPSTGFLKLFDLRLIPPGFLLLFPSYKEPEILPQYLHYPKMFAVLQEYESWSRILGVRTVADLNELVDQQRVREYVLIAEALHEKKLGRIADMLDELPNKPRVILLAGPSSSGKTTTVKRLAIQLRVNGLRPAVIGMDDFFVERERTPLDENGEYDFESFDAIDVDQLQKCVRGLLKGEEVQLPKFDFIQGKPVPGHKLRLEPNQPLILEGIHALNTKLLSEIPDGLKFKIYVSPLTHLNIDDHNRISSSDARLIRRLVRDSRFRGYDANATISRWPSVRRGEERNIFPYQDNADYIFNSSLHYEVCVLRQYAEPLLEGLERSNSLFSEASRLKKLMSYFQPIKTDVVPRHSLLREFIGGSSFKY